MLISLGPDPVPQSMSTFTIGELGLSVEADASAVTASGEDPASGFTVRTATGPPAEVSELEAEPTDGLSLGEAEGDGNA